MKRCPAVIHDQTLTAFPLQKTSFSLLRIATQFPSVIQQLLRCMPSGIEHLKALVCVRLHLALIYSSEAICERRPKSA
jgi:hypothetical protein